MIRVQVHMAVTDELRALAATMAGLSGNPMEHPTELRAIPGGPAAQWSAEKGYSGKWWAASQAFAATIAQAMLQSGYAKKTGSFYVAYWEGTEELISGGPETIPFNTPTQPANASHDAFLESIGCERVVPPDA